MRRTSWDKSAQAVEWQAEDLDKATALCANRRLAIQAGGLWGVWPLRLAQHFADVLTFEPNADNFECLEENIADTPNIHASRAALGKNLGRGSMRNNKLQNAGTGYVVAGDDFPIITIDSINFGIGPVDLIALDVEGWELAALQGAAATIERDSPVIMVERKDLPQLAELGVTENSAIEWLEARGYRAVERIHRDVILTRK